MNSVENLPLRTLLRMVHHRQPEQESRIAAILRLADFSVVVRQMLEQALGAAGLSDRGFATLVALHARDPEPVTPADLAYHIDSPRSSVSATVDQLVRSGRIMRSHDRDHRGAARLTLTPAGRQLADQTITAFLEAAARISRHAPRETCDAISTLCDTLRNEPNAGEVSLSGTTPTLP